jgi:uncharacterized membrane protein
MASLSQAKTLGGVGAILIFIPFVSIVGYILIILAIRDISQDMKDKSIFNNVVIAAVTGIIGAVAGAAVFIFGAATSVFTGGVSAFAGIIVGLLIVWVFLIISAIFLRKAYNSISMELGVKMFGTAATLYLVGAVLTIVLVGFLVLFIAQILQAVAYFQIPDVAPMQGAGASPGPMGGPSGSMGGPSGSMGGPSGSMAPPMAGPTKFCVSCGTKLASTATFCYNCGAKQP